MSTKNYPTPHINSTPDQISKTVLMPGDPLRAEFVARNFLENATLFNNVRGVCGYICLLLRHSAVEKVGNKLVCYAFAQKNILCFGKHAEIRRQARRAVV